MIITQSSATLKKKNERLRKYSSLNDRAGSLRMVIAYIVSLFMEFNRALLIICKLEAIIHGQIV